jgi:SAM-dependent methyltransferase
MLDSMLRTLRKPRIRNRVVPLLRRFGLLGVAFRRYEIVRARQAAESDTTTWPDHDNGLPLPPAELRALVSGAPDPGWFLAFGRAMFDTIATTAARHGSPISQMHRVLEFGCGSGRVLRHWQDVRGPELHGTDYNPALAAWCESNLPFATIGRNQLDPPLSYADASFDLVYAISVFTHLKESLQHAWMAELRRVLVPGGLLIMTTHGSSLRQILTTEECAAFDAGALVVRYEETSGMNLCSAYHPESFVRDTLASGFLVRELIPSGQRELIGQDVYVLEKLPPA